MSKQDEMDPKVEETGKKGKKSPGHAGRAGDGADFLVRTPGGCAAFSDVDKQRRAVRRTRRDKTRRNPRVRRSARDSGGIRDKRHGTRPSFIADNHDSAAARPVIAAAARPCAVFA